MNVSWIANEGLRDTTYFDRMQGLAEAQFAIRGGPNGSFPIANYSELKRYRDLLSQKAVYRALVKICGREETIEGLESFLPAEVVRLQVSVLAPDTEI